MTATTNLVTNPSFEVNTTGWTNSGLDTCIRATTDSRYGTCCLYIADTVSVASEYVSSPVMAVTAGTTYTASAWVGRSTIADASYTGNFSISWFTGAMAKISEATLALPAGTFPWLRITLTAIAPPTAAYALIYFGDAGITAGSWNLGIDGVQFEAQPAATAYCDGDQPGCAWSGTAHASTSTRTAGAAYTTITITDDTTTLTLTDGRNYALVDQGWAPGVAQLRISTLGGRGPYEDVVEQLTLNVLGETGVEALYNLGELSRMLDQAERWNRGELVAAVKLTYQPQGSVLTTALQCVILGRAGGSAVSNSATFNDLLMCYEISNVQLAFVRRGLWLEAEETLAATSAAANPGIRTGTFASVATIASPAKAVLTFPSDTDVNQYTVLWANNAARHCVFRSRNHNHFLRCIDSR